MTLAQFKHYIDRLLSPKEALEYLEARYGLKISIATFYTMVSRGDAPKPTYFRGRPKFLALDLDEWVRGNLSRYRK
jgi:predicted DNA-binding transcriptional regulator AlpA